MVEKQTQYITIALAALIIIAASIIIYTSLPTGTNELDLNEDENQSSNETNNQTIDNSNIHFSVLYNSTETEYDLEELESLISYTGKGQYIKTKLLPDSIVISELYNYTGVQIKSFFNLLDTPLPENFNITVTSSDGWVVTYTKNQTLGEVICYDENGSILTNQTSIMLLAYKEDGAYYNEIDPDGEIGPLRIVIVGSTDSVITSSNLWSKMVTSLEIIPLP